MAKFVSVVCKLVGHAPNRKSLKYTYGGYYAVCQTCSSTIRHNRRGKWVESKAIAASQVETLSHQEVRSPLQVGESPEKG